MHVVSRTSSRSLLPSARIVALIAIGLTWAATRLPALGGEERAALAARFSFTQLPLAESSQGERRERRSVNPSVERFAGWISAVGAAVALADLDADGLANDGCHVDPRSDLVTVAPAPGTGARYPLFLLEPTGSYYDARTMAPMGCVPNDLNEDGRLDLLVYYWGRTPVAFVRRTDAVGPLRPDHFVAREIVPEQERWYTNAATFADLDGDGHQDLVLGNYFPDGTRLLDAQATEPVSMQHSMSRAANGGRNRVFRWRGAQSGGDPDVSFEEVPGLFPERAEHAWTLAIGAADLDGDLLPELYYANDFGPDWLFHNLSRPGELRFAPLQGERRVTDPRSKVLGGDSFKGMGIDFADLNGDGLLDFFVSNIAAEYALMENHLLFVSTGDSAAMQRGVAPYRDESEAYGVARSDWSWDVRFGDFDNDGRPEILQAMGFLRGERDRWPELQELATGNDALLALSGSWPRFSDGDDLSGHTSNPFYVRAADGRYYDLSSDLGLDAPSVTRGIATADVDGDGDLDFAVANQWQTSYLYRNDAEQRGVGRSLGLRLLLPVDDPDAGRPAVGASVRIERADGVVLVGQVDGGNGHSGKRSPELHFGLGDSAAPAHVSIHYRDRHGVPARHELSLAPGWHRIVLPDATAQLIASSPDAGGLGR